MKTKWPTEMEVATAMERVRKANEEAVNNQINDAFYRLVGYCAKHVDCDSCRFNTQEDGCLFIDNSTPLCDWKMPEESEVE